MNHHLRNAVLTLLLAVGLAGCGGDDEATPSVTEVPVAPPTQAIVVETTTTLPPTTTTEATTTTAPTTTTTTAPPLPTAPNPALLDGDLFFDPDLDYVIVIPFEWDVATEDIPDGIEAWFVGQPSGGFQPNVNILSAPAGGFTLDDYINIGIQSLEDTLDDFVFIDSRVLERSNGPTLSVVEVSGSGLQFRQYTFVENSTAVILTVTAPPDLFQGVVDEYELFFETLMPVSP